MMINNYFNSHEANKIIELIKSNPYLARNMFEEDLIKVRNSIIYTIFKGDKSENKF